jgi:hypothetical protein
MGNGIFSNLTLNKNAGTVKWLSDGTVNCNLRLLEPPLSLTSDKNN